MKLIIAGGRDMMITPDHLHRIFNYFFPPENPKYDDLGFITEIVSGTCSGIDLLGEQYAKDMLHANIKRFPADWKTYGKSAGPIRNRQMANYADALLLIWDGESKGSASMYRIMKSLGKPVYEIRLEGK